MGTNDEDKLELSFHGGGWFCNRALNIERKEKLSQVFSNLYLTSQLRNSLHPV